VNGHGNAIGWGTLTLINAGLAQGKGRSGLAWWMLSLIFGPMATLFIVVLPAVWPAPEKPTEAWSGRETDRV
jgi:hypothetical protein